MHNRARSTLYSLKSLSDDMFPGLSQNLDGHIIGEIMNGARYPQVRKRLDGYLQ